MPRRQIIKVLTMCVFDPLIQGSQEGELEMLALDIHFIQGYFGNPVSSISCPGLVCFALPLFCFVL